MPRPAPLRTLVAAAALMVAAGCGLALDTDATSGTTTTAPAVGPGVVPGAGSSTTTTGPAADADAPTPEEIAAARIEELERDSPSRADPLCAAGADVAAAGARLFQTGIDGVLVNDQVVLLAGQFVDGLSALAAAAEDLSSNDRTALDEAFAEFRQTVQDLTPGASIKTPLLALVEGDADALNALLTLQVQRCPELADVFGDVPIDAIIESIRNS